MFLQCMTTVRETLALMMLSVSTQGNHLDMHAGTLSQVQVRYNYVWDKHVSFVVTGFDQFFIYFQSLSIKMTVDSLLHFKVICKSTAFINTNYELISYPMF